MDFIQIIILVILFFILVVFVGILFYLKSIAETKQQSANMQLRVEKLKLITPLKIQAYERLTVMLERMVPGKLLLRLNAGSKTAAQLQLEMMKSIRQEYEHNISMQMYVSDISWKQVTQAKEDALELIKKAGSLVDQSSNSLLYSQKVLELEARVGNGAMQSALTTLKNEISTEF